MPFVSFQKKPTHMQGVLRTRVRSRKWGSDLSGRTGDDSEGTLASFDEVRQYEAGQVDNGEDVEVEEVPVHLYVGVLPSRSLTLAGVVNHYVQLQAKP